ncbi:MAG: DUF3466 family protein [Phycisphaerales bacterium]|nr:MAG: DUF3466 family protein [Phycisphaerales bacterium]
MIIDLGTLGGWTSTALGINDAGQVVGGADLPNGMRHGFLWDNGAMIDLGTLLGDEPSECWDINNLGQVVCNSYRSYSSTAFLWENGNTIDLGKLAGATDTSAVAINDAQQIVGRSHVGFDEDHAFLWEDGLTRDLTLDGFATRVAWDISNAGHVVGGGFLWQDGVLTELGSLGWGPAEAVGVNDLGQVVGSAQGPPDDVDPFVIHGFLCENGVMTDLGIYTTFRHSQAQAINNLGEVVGQEIEHAVVRRAFLYDADQGMRKLLDLIPLDSGWWYWYRLRPRDINDAGQIVGTATFNGLRRAFLMTPIDADFDDDNDTDLVDFSAFRSCMTGPRTGVEEQCRAHDINRDGRNDLVDLRAFQWEFTGP